MKRFTLIELLIVIAVIAILASLLLPALQKAKESARGAVCIGQLKQLHLAAINYASDYDEELPYVTDSYSGNTERNDCNLSFKVARDYWGGPCDQDSGLVKFYRLNYVPLEIFRCPSKTGEGFFGWNCQPISFNQVKLFAKTSGLANGGYGYRFNHQQVYAKVYVKKPFLHTGATKNPVLFWDASSRNRVDDNSARTAALKTQPYNIIKGTGKLYDWAHVKGGHMGGYDGSVRWIPNFMSPSSANWIWKARSWPAMEWDCGFIWPYKQNSGDPTGYDELFND